ncbi:BadF/BadG/BcrA/BcrD ATPase family [Musa troglodytarum]|uniref:BadF/BadG/BcrA/BcrD ATPase family n=1 Tax=Musa troglodytarum TaxID=320322 RepID=A0A9E7GSA0_9LILI|nr:BadF/BadG/BcrA/BcrD ATPase family [Musa troglodytarum]
MTQNTLPIYVDVSTVKAGRFPNVFMSPSRNILQVFQPHRESNLPCGDPTLLLGRRRRVS